MQEKYYWETADGTLIPVHELTDLHVCNIVMKFGKDRLRNMGHAVIADHFEDLNHKYKFFNQEIVLTNSGTTLLFKEEEMEQLEILKQALIYYHDRDPIDFDQEDLRALEDIMIKLEIKFSSHLPSKTDVNGCPLDCPCRADYPDCYCNH